MSLNIQRDQLRFMQAMEQPRYPYQLNGKLSDEVDAELDRALQLCDKLIHEEVVIELLPALRNYGLTRSDTHLVEVFDGCIDGVYVIMQLMNTLGLPFPEGWDEVHRSNMAKRIDGKIVKNAAGKVLKPAGWKSPDLATIVAKGYSEVEGTDDAA